MPTFLLTVSTSAAAPLALLQVAQAPQGPARVLQVPVVVRDGELSVLRAAAVGRHTLFERSLRHVRHALDHHAQRCGALVRPFGDPAVLQRLLPVGTF